MASWFATLRRNWHALLACALFWTAVAIYVGPGYYFVILYVLLCLLIGRTALRR